MARATTGLKRTLQHFVAAFLAGDESFGPFEGTGGRSYIRGPHFDSRDLRVLHRPRRDEARALTMARAEHRFEVCEHRFDPREHRLEAQEHRLEPHALRFDPLTLTTVRVNSIF